MIGAFEVPPFFSVGVIIGSMIIISLGAAMIIPNCLSLALEDYQHAIGTAFSFFGLLYHGLTSLFTLGMGLSHNDTLYPMPIYFFGISFLVLIIFLKVIGYEIEEEKNASRVYTTS